MDITEGMQLSKGHQPRTKIKSHIGNFASEIVYISPEFLKGSCQECFLIRIPAYAEGPVQVPLLTVKPSKPQAVTWSDFHSTFLCERFYNLCEKESGASQFCHYRQIYKTHTSFLYGQLHFQVNVFWHKQ